MEDFTKYTKEELQDLLENTVNEFNEYNSIVAQAYDGMLETSRLYNQIIDELNKRN